MGAMAGSYARTGPSDTCTMLIAVHYYFLLEVYNLLIAIGGKYNAKFSAASESITERNKLNFELIIESVRFR